jgi:tetratricopeptide (TPR) repeat protein
MTTAVTARQHLAVAAGLGALVGLAYANSLHAGFTLDNRLLLLEDPRLRATTSQNLGLILTQDYWFPTAVGGVYRPLATLSYLFNYAVLGNADRPEGYHVVNLLLHWGNAVLVYLLALLVIGTRGPAVLTAALFATHPIATEAVTNIIGRADILAAAAVLGGCLLHASAARAEGWRRALCLAALALVAAAGALSKENAVVIVGVILLYDLASERRAEPVGRTVAPYAVVLAAIVAVWIVRAWLFAALAAPERPFVDNPLRGAGFWTARATAVKVLGRYLWTLLWPQALSCDWSFDQIAVVDWHFRRWEDWQAILAVAVVTAALAVAVRSRRTDPSLFFFVLLFFATALPTSNLVMTIGTIMAERLMYLPVVGFVGALVLGAHAIARRLGPRWATGILAVVVLAYGARTFARNADWRDDVSLWTAAVHTSPRSASAHQSLAFALVRQDGPGYPNVDRSIAEGEAAVAILDAGHLAPVDVPSSVFLELGTYYEIKAEQLRGGTRDGTRGDSSAALVWYRKAAAVLARAVEADRAYTAARRGWELARGRRPEEIVDLGNYALYVHVGDVALALSRPTEAIDAFTYMRHLAPNSADAHFGLGRAYVAAGRAEDAAVPLLQAIALDSHRDAAWQLLFDVYRRIDPAGCALAGTTDHPSLDRRCPLVHAHLCTAYAQLAAMYRGARQEALAAQLDAAASRAYGCPAVPASPPTP